MTGEGSRARPNPIGVEAGGEVGVLALQGAYALHLAALARMGLTARAVTRRADLDGITHLIIPGGESTVISQLLLAEGLAEPLRQALGDGSLAAFGTCAGAILLGREPAPDADAAGIAGGRAAPAGPQSMEPGGTAGPSSSAAATPAPPASAGVPRQPVRLGVACTEVARNAYGRQIDSFRTRVPLAGSLATFAGPDHPEVEAFFIRAPRFVALPAGAEVLARRDGEPVLVREGRLLLSAFHPELTDDPTVHAYFLSL
jgi:5'-phosphate synthase pdxT subunit